MSKHSKKTKKEVEFLLPGEGQVIGIVTKSVGNMRYLVTTKETADMNCRLRGALSKVRFGSGTAVIVESYLNVNNIIYVYNPKDVKTLRDMDLLPKLENTFQPEGSSSAEIEFDIDEI